MDTFRDQDAAAEYARGLLRGERIRLRAATDEDLAEVERWWNDPETAVLQQASILPRPGGAVNDLLRSWSANASPGSVGFAVEEEADGSLAGHVALWGGAAPQRCGTLAVVLGPYARGRGLGTDAVRTLVRYASPSWACTASSCGPGPSTRGHGPRTGAQASSRRGAGATRCSTPDASTTRS
ncbi:GNAT family N-acetyltransferase [Rathayibacter tanaceti]|uniref:N-acetyltransferase domain-containing protein n=1 Tax=Rathayibacter tanaceti TaxID=1671680 RepID=A0A166HP05_9MICO|nr:GNAT family N-acetyltransferase [Rathayibacter tanaceti]KZX20933.1 hypothetical protein ACH61_01952 [Rathayibacter tanaceti]